MLLKMNYIQVLIFAIYSSTGRGPCTHEEMEYLQFCSLHFHDLKTTTSSHFGGICIKPSFHRTSYVSVSVLKVLTL